MQYFYINQGSVLPVLRVELINDGRYDFMKSANFNNAIQNADITFSMWDDEGNIKISKQQCTIILSNEQSCDERYIIEYKWKKRDTKYKGEFIGTFNIEFKGDTYEEGQTYESGNLIMPIIEDLIISIK